MSDDIEDKDKCTCNDDSDCNCIEEGGVPVEEEFQGGELGIYKKKVENLEKQLDEKTNELLRKAADLDNYRKRITKESEDRIKYANQSVVIDFLPVLDNLLLSLNHAEDNSPLTSGVELTLKSFMDVLGKHGVKEIDCEVGTAFDPNFHDALMMDNNPELPDNTITFCMQKGYILNGRVIRHAKVKVNKIA